MPQTSRTSTTKPAKRSYEPRPVSFSQALGRVWVAVNRPWGDNPTMTAREKANERAYLDACDAVTGAEINSRIDALAALNYLLADRCDHDAEYVMTPILEKVRACIEEKLTERGVLPLLESA